ncbi:hypothetical protein JRQ81_008002 [Phrynocephalus forsythii]|uniref:Uncharacterized protein n=1 Tax=Phrynocephalus forsythii TaxID=171643 RepID=A0A9Q0XCS2_9SAUR|nr:hypothetical protein JRQ81_008002 [Phrynocephalus forsythii]
MEESCPVSAVLSGDPSNVPGEDHFLKWDDKPASPPHPACSRLTDLPSFIPVDGGRSTRGGLLESFQHQGRGHLAVGRLGAQHLQTPAFWFCQRDGPWTGLSSKTPSSPHAEGYSSGTFSIKSEAEGQAGLLVPEKDHTCSPVQASACVDSAPGPEENGVHSEGRQPGAGRIVSGTLGNPDLSSKETEPSQEEDQRGSRPAPGARGPSAVLVEGLTFPVGEDEKGGEVRLPGPASLPECPSESGLAEAQDPSKSTENTERHEIGPSFPRRNILPETLSGSMTFAFRDGRALEASMLGLGRDGRGWQAVEGSGKTPGDPRELPEWLSGSPVNEVPVKTSGAAEPPGSPSLAEKAFGAEAGPVATQPGGTCAALHQRKRTARKARAGAPSRPRILAVGRPLGSTSFQRVVSPGDLGHWAFLPRSRWRGSEKWGPHSTFWEPGRPKRSQALMGPRQREGGRGPRRLQEPLRPSKDKDCLFRASACGQPPLVLAARKAGVPLKVHPE